MVRRSQITRFSRNARKHPKWDMGTPTNPRGRQRLRDTGIGWRGQLLKWTVISVFVLAFAGPVADVVNGYVKPRDGCRVIGVTDGDTVKMICEDSGYQPGRVMGYDTPEYRAKCPSELRRAVAATYDLRWQLYKADEISVFPRGHDRYGRRLILLNLDGVPAAEVMIASGLARGYAGGKRQSWCG